jgi:rRNA processing protein Gar1
MHITKGGIILDNDKIIRTLEDCIGAMKASYSVVKDIKGKYNIISTVNDINMLVLLNESIEEAELLLNELKE